MNDEAIPIPGDRLLPFQVRKHGEIVGPGFNTLDDAIAYVHSLKRADIQFEIEKDHKLVWPPKK